MPTISDASLTRGLDALCSRIQKTGQELSGPHPAHIAAGLAEAIENDRKAVAEFNAFLNPPPPEAKKK